MTPICRWSVALNTGTDGCPDPSTRYWVETFHEGRTFYYAFCGFHYGKLCTGGIDHRRGHEITLEEYIIGQVMAT